MGGSKVFKPKYAVGIRIADGPDDSVIEENKEFSEYTECIAYATLMHDKGHEVSIFDPHLGKTIKFPEGFK